MRRRTADSKFPGDLVCPPRPFVVWGVLDVREKWQERMGQVDQVVRNSVGQENPHGSASNRHRRLGTPARPADVVVQREGYSDDGTSSGIGSAA